MFDLSIFRSPFHNKLLLFFVLIGPNEPNEHCVISLHQTLLTLNTILISICCPGSVVVDPLFIIAPIVCGGFCV